MSRDQLRRLGLSDHAIAHRVAGGRLVIVAQGVLAVAPVIDDDHWGHWMAATLTAPRTVLSHASAATAWALLSQQRSIATVTRPGSGGPRRHGAIQVFRSRTVADDATVLRNVPITSVERTLLDIAPRCSERALARAVREAVRLHLTSVAAIAGRSQQPPARRGSRRLAAVLARYADLPIERARSGAEVRALEVIRDAGCALPRLNARIGGEEADLSWPSIRLIVEIDGPAYHLDRGEDARKQAIWERCGWTVMRIPASAVHERPTELLRLTPGRHDGAPGAPNVRL